MFEEVLLEHVFKNRVLKLSRAYIYKAHTNNSFIHHKVSITTESIAMKFGSYVS